MPESKPKKWLKVWTHVKREPEEKNLMVRIGNAVVEEDGSINVRLNACPVDGTLLIRERKGS